MKSAVFWGLLALNVLLVAVLWNKYSPENQARAQARPSDYLTVPGVLTGVPTGVVFIVDTSRGELSAMTYDDTRDALIPMPKIDLGQVFKAGAGVGPGNKGVKPR